MEAFRACVKQLEVRDGQGLPSLYANARTFWLNPPSSYFTLRKDTLSPSALYNPRFFIWDPQALFKDLLCPNCKKVLHRHSVISRPRRCVDVSSTFWIIGFRYRCRHCLNPRTQKIGILHGGPGTRAFWLPCHVNSHQNFLQNSVTAVQCRCPFSLDAVLLPKWGEYKAICKCCSSPASPPIRRAPPAVFELSCKSS